MSSAIRRIVPMAMAAALVSSAASGSAVEEAGRIYAEGKEVLKEARAPGGDVVKGSKAAISLFEKAASLLGEPPDGTPEAELLQDINSMIFWTRRTTPSPSGSEDAGQSKPTCGPVPIMTGWRRSRRSFQRKRRTCWQAFAGKCAVGTAQPPSVYPSTNWS